MVISSCLYLSQRDHHHQYFPFPSLSHHLFILHSAAMEQTDIQISTPSLQIKQAVIQALKSILYPYDDPEAVYHLLEECFSLQSCQAVLANAIGVNGARMHAASIFQLMGRANMSQPHIQHLFYRPQIRTLPPEDVGLLRELVNMGRKERFRRQMVRLLGVHAGNMLYKEYENDILEFKPSPLVNTQLLSQENGLEIYRYPEDMVRKAEQNEGKNLLVVGQTGSGKSSFINSVLNFLLGVDIDDQFRYKIVVETVENQMNSVTNTVKKYTIKSSNGDIYNIFDTPGFGDTRGVANDRKTFEKLQSMIKKKEINEIHGVLLVMKYSASKATNLQNYIFQKVTELFGKDIASNFMFVLTFYDSTNNSPILDFLQNEEKGFGAYWNDLTEPKYIQINNQILFQKFGAEKVWDYNMAALKQLFLKIDSIAPNCLNMTADMINKKQNLILRIKEGKEELNRSLKNHQNLIKYMEEIAKHEKEILENKQFEVIYPALVITTQPWATNVVKCFACMQSNCHKGCIREGLQKCRAFDKKGNCTVCPGKCPLKNHFRSKEIRWFQRVTLKKTFNDKKAKYMSAQKSQKEAIQAFKNISLNLTEVIHKILVGSQEICDLYDELNGISLASSKKQTVKEYLKFVMEEEKKSKSKNAARNIQACINAINEYEILTENASGNMKKQTIQQMTRFHQNYKAWIEAISNRATHPAQVKDGQKYVLSIPRTSLGNDAEQRNKVILQKLQEEQLKREGSILKQSQTLWQKFKQPFVG